MTKTTYTDEEIARNRADWIAYLREPGRKKAIGQLVDNDDHERRCCLGHYCAMKGLPVEKAVSKSGQDGYEGEVNELPERLAASLGITQLGYFKGDVLVWHLTGNKRAFAENLAAINDRTRASMADIADIIEREFEAHNFEPMFVDEMP